MKRRNKKDWENPLQEYWSCLNVTNISKPIREKCFLTEKFISYSLCDKGVTQV